MGIYRVGKASCAYMFYEEGVVMRIQIQPEAKELLEKERHSLITLRADRECVGANCSETYMYPVISFKLPEESDERHFDRFEVDGVTVFVERELETMPEVNIVREHHILKDRLIATTQHEAPIMTHFKF
jgi:hypothetical protein